MSTSEFELTLAQQLQELSETVAVLKDALGNRLRVTLRTLNDRTYLGQSVGVVAKVTDLLSGEPRADVPVTFASTWGRLESVAGYVLEKGNLLTELTDGDGLVTVMMVPPLSEELTLEQKAAVETLLRTFATDAATPQQVLPELQEMVTQYRWEANASFREAVDIFFQEFRPNLRETVGQRDRMLRWSYFESTVVAYAQGTDVADEASSTSVLSSAVLNLRFKDWLGPFLQTYFERAADEDSLGSNLKNSKGGSQDGNELLGNFYGHIRDYVANERGFVGSHVGGRVAADSLRKFIGNGLADLPLGTRVSVAEGLRVASGTIATAGVSVLEGFAHTGTELRQELSTQLSGEAGSALSGIRKSIETEASNSLETFKNQLGGLRAGSLQGHQAELGGLRASHLDGFRKDITGIRADTLNGFQTEAGNVRTGALQGLRNDAVAFRDSTLKAFQTDVDKLKLNSTDAFNVELGNVRTSTLQGFQSALTAARDATLKGFQSDAGATRVGVLQGLQADITKARGDSFAGFLRDVSGDVTMRLQGFQNDLNTFREGSFKNFQTSVGTAQANALQGFSSSLVQTRTGHLQGFQQDAASVRDLTFKGLQTDMGNFRAATLTTFQNEAGGLKTNLLLAFQNEASGVRTSILQDLQRSAVTMKDSTVKTLQVEVANVRTTSLSAFQTDVTNVKAANVQLAASEMESQRNSHVKSFNTDLAGARVASLQEFQGTLKAEASNNLISTRVNRLENSVTAAHSNIATLQTRGRL